MADEHVLLCTDTFIEQHGERLSVAAPSLDVVELADHAAADDELARITMAFMSKDAWPDRAGAFLDAAASAPNLRWLHVMAAGIEGPTFDAFRDRGVMVTRTPGASANAIAETVFMYLHALERDVRSLDEVYRARRWEWHEWRQLEGRTMTVLGYGPIGRRIVHLARAYDMVPTVVRRTVRGIEPCRTVPVAELADAVADADVVVVAVPLTPETIGLVSADLVARMPPGAVLVNVARGGVVDQRAVTDALADGHLGGAGLDVFDPEPLDTDDPLWDLPNVILTPHNAGSSNLGPQKVVDIFFEHLARYLDNPDHPDPDPARAWPERAD